MRRDISLVLNILSTIAQHPGESVEEHTLIDILGRKVLGSDQEGWDGPTTRGHITLLQDAGYIAQSETGGVTTVRITWQGHEYLESQEA